MAVERRFDVPAGSTEKLDVDWPLDLYRDGASELVLEVSQRLAKATNWAVAGYELAFGQTVVAGSKKASTPVKPVDGTVTVGRWNVGVQGSGREVLLSAPKADWSPPRSTIENSCCAVRRSPRSAR